MKGNKNFYITNDYSKPEPIYSILPTGDDSTKVEIITPAGKSMWLQPWELGDIRTNLWRVINYDYKPDNR